MKKTLVILVILTSLFPVLLFPQNYHTRNFTMQDGMPGNSVRAIYKDSSGYLWVGTDAGLCRFDGKKFRIYSSMDGFAGNKIWSITEDGDNNLWFGDYGGGLWKYDGNKFLHFTDEDSLVNNNVRSLHYSNTHKLLFIGTQYGLTIYDGKNFTNFNKENSFLAHDPYIMGFIEKENVIYIYTFSNINLAYYPKTKTLAPIPENLSYSKGAFLTCLKKSDGTSLFTYRNGLATSTGIDTLQNIRKPVNAPFNKDIGQVFGMAEDKYQNVWLASWEPNPKNPGGLFLFDGEKVMKKNNILGKDPLSGWAVHFDAENKILWFGTLDMGLFMIQESIFEYLDPQDFGLDKFNVNDITFDKNDNPILLDEKNLIITYSDKPSWKVSDKLFFKAYKKYLNKEKIIDERAWDYNSFVKVLELKKLIFQNDNVLWVMSDPGLFSVNLETKKITCLSKTGYGERFIFFNQQKQLCNIPGWGRYGIFTNIESGNELNNFDNIKIIPKDISDFVVHNNNLWLTSWSKGLFIGSDSNFVNYKSSNTSIRNSLNALCFDNHGNLIIGTNSGEVHIMNPTKDTITIVKTLNENDGIFGNSITWMKADKQNHLWAGTNLGLNRIDLNGLGSGNLEILHLDNSEGYPDPNVNVSVMDKDGNIWLGTETGLCKLNIQKNKFDTINTKGIKLITCEINGKPVNDMKKSSLDLSHKENYLHFDFDVVNFINPEKDRFRYFFEGIDLNWSEFSDARHTTYPHLPPGKYTFKVEGKNLNTGLYYSPLTLEIFIRVPYWRSWWFISLVVIFIASSVWFYFKYRINQTRNAEQKKAEVSKQLAELEMKALLAQMNPHFTFNAINSIQNYILDNDVDKALSYLSDFAKIIRQTLENASKEFISLEEEIDFLKRYLHLEQMRFDFQFSQDIYIDPAIDPETTQVPPMIFQPYIENAIKHGLRHKKSRGKLMIRFSIKDTNILSCTIEDNGIGRKASEKINKAMRKDHNGTGMAITKNRIQKLKEIYKSELFNVDVIDLFTSNNRSKGTRIEIYLPLIQSF